MKVLKEVKLKTKDDICKAIKQQKILPFFLVYHKMVQYNIINSFFYIIVLILEYLFLFFELSNDGEDYITPIDSIKQSSSYYLFKGLQYINFTHFLSNTYLSYSQFIIVYIIVVCLILINFLLLIIVDFINKKKTNTTTKLKAIHAILGLYNFLNIKIVIMPITYVLFESYQISTYSKTVTTNININSRMDVSQNIILETKNQAASTFDTIGIPIVTTIALLINIYSLINTSLLFNDLDPFENQICWAQSYPQIEMYNINLKILLLLFNIIKGKFLFIKSIFALFINLFRCTYRYYEWYYSWSVNKILLVVLDFTFLFYNFITFIFGDNKDKLHLLICFISLSVIFGISSFIVIEKIQKGTIAKDITTFKNERDFCHLIMQLLQVIQCLPQDNKTLNDSVFFGFLIQHKKHCSNQYCTAKLITDVIYSKQAIFNNDIDDFVITKSELCSYCKTDKNDNFEMFQDTSKVHCEKTLYFVIKCIIDYGMKVLPSNQTLFLPILESYLYMHIFNNKFYALFEVMKYYKPEAQYREKFFFFMSLSNIMNKISEESNLKYTSMASLITVTDYYYFHNKFTKVMRSVLTESKNIFAKLISMQPSAIEILQESELLGIQLKKLHMSYNRLMVLNPYEINVQRIYTFTIEILFDMKNVARQYRLRLLQNMKFFLMNDKFKNPNTELKEIQSKMTIKNFQENSDSAIIIISGILENIGEVLYCNELLTTILGFQKEEIIGFSVNIIIPQPISFSHDQIILHFYKTGERFVVDKVKNRFALHKNGFLLNIDLYITFMPNIDYGIMFIGIFKNSYLINLKSPAVEEKSEIIELIRRESNHSGVILERTNSLSKKKNEIGQFKRNTLAAKTVLNDNKQRKNIKKTTTKSKQNSVKIINNQQNHRNKISNKMNCLFKAEETGIIVCNKKFDILHTNIHFLINYLGITKCLPIGKINMKKICKEFISKVPDMERGETVPILLDFSNANYINNLIPQNMSTLSKDGSLTSKKSVDYTTSMDESLSSISKGKKRQGRFTSNSSFHVKSVKVSLTTYSVINNKGKESYYILTIQNYLSKENQSEQLSEEENDEMIMDYDDTSLFSSQTSRNKNEGKDDNYQINHKENIKSIESIKEKLLNDSYMSGFTKATNITIYTLLLIIIAWLIISYVLELNELLTIQNDLRIHNRNESFIQVLSHYVIETLLIIRANTFSFVNVKLNPLLIQMMKDEEESINNLLQFIHSDTSTKSSQLFRDTISKTNIQFQVISIDNTQFNSTINMEIGIDNIVLAAKYLLLSSNYRDFHESEFFDPNFINLLKTKFYFIYSNYFINIFDHLEHFSNLLETNLYSQINDKRRSLLIIFTVSIVFCVIVSVIIIITLINQEHRKKDFLVLLGNKHDSFYSEKITLINQFRKSMEIVFKEDQNMHKNKQFLDKDEYYKDIFISGEKFFERKEEEIIISNNFGLLNPISSGFVQRLKEINNPTSNRQLFSPERYTKENSIKQNNKQINSNQNTFIIDKMKLDTSEEKSNKTELDNTDKEKEITNASKSIFSEMIRNLANTGPRIDKVNPVKSLLKQPILFKKSKTQTLINSKSPPVSSEYRQSEEGLLNSLNPSNNPNLVVRNSFTKTTTIIKNSIDKEKNKDKDYDNENQPLDDSKNSLFQEKEYIHKSFTEYNIPWKKSFANFIISTIYISSFFILSIVYMYYYLGEIKQVVEVSSMFSSRAKLITNILIAENINILYLGKNFVPESYLVLTLISKLQQLEDHYKSVLTKISKNNPTYDKILLYESSELCREFTHFNTTYNIIDCESYLEGHGASFEIATINHYIYELQLKLQNNINPTLEDKKKHFNDPFFVNYMLKNTLFLRFYLMDIIFTYERYYDSFISTTIKIFHVKFAIYTILLIILISVYQMYLLPKITETINNLTRVKLYFDEKNFNK